MNSMVTKIVMNLKKMPNADLYRKAGVNCFGKVVSIPREVMEMVRFEILGRNEEGLYLYRNRMERRKMAPVRV